MNIIITRIRKTTIALDGRLTIDGKHICDTTENADCHLPEGRYTIRLDKCRVRSRIVPLIVSPDSCHDCPLCKRTANKNEKAAMSLIDRLDKCPEEKDLLPSHPKKLPMPFCPRLAFGNGVCNRTDGAILVGTYRSNGLVIHSKQTFDNLYERIRKAVERGRGVTITIHNA